MEFCAADLMASSGGKEIECVISPRVITCSCESRGRHKFVEQFRVQVLSLRLRLLSRRVLY